MPKIVEILELKGNPFEHYVAEQEPNIAEYAVKPPYFAAINGRATNASSFILFGDRGAGKSATRLTIFKELWRQKSEGKSVPLAVNMVDFSSVVKGRALDISEAALIRDVAFFVIESLLTWLSALEEDDRKVYLEGQNDEERTLCYGLIRDFYMSRPAAMRERTVHEAMVLLNQALLSKGTLWVTKQWGKVAGLIGVISEVLTKSLGGKGDVAVPVSQILATSDGESGFDSVLVLRNLVRFAAIFDFSGIALLIDKVDETSATNNSADQTAAMIHPLLARVQLMEVSGFGWIFFLWTAVKGVFEGTERPVRLDKLGYATVSWDDKFFSLMLDRRTEYFSDKRFAWAGFFREDVDVGATLAEIVRVSMRSPREVIRIMDVIIREHDIIHADGKPELINPESIEKGLDIYVTDRISTIYGERLLGQIFRLNRSSFTNKDVQRVFRVGAQSARTRIQSWENAGIIKLIGTKAAEGGLGRPVNEYSVVDARIERVMQRQLITYDTPVVAEADFVETETEE